MTRPTDADANEQVVGRAIEIEAVEAFLDRAAGRLTLLVLDGGPGIGKTAIWEAALESARDRGFRTLQTRPAQAEHGLALAGLTDLFERVDETVLRRLAGPQRHALEVALLRIEPSGTLPDQRALGVSVAAALRLLTEHEPILLAVDDAQWLDESTAAILAYAVRRLPDRSIGLLLSERTRASSDAVVTADLATAVPSGRTQRLRLGPLSLASLHRLFLVRLGRSFTRLALVRIEAASGGNALYALELARAIPSADFPLDPHAAVPVPDSLGSLVTGRIASLPTETRRALVLVAAAADPTLETLQRAEPGWSKSIVPAVAEGIVAVAAGAVRFGHPLFAQSALGLASPDELRSVHARLAAATASRDARAYHLGQAADAPDEVVAVELAEAADRARSRGATLDAAALYLEAGRATPPLLADRRLERARLAAECLFIDLSEAVQADAILEAAVAVAPPGPGRADALSLRAIVRYYHGRVPEAVALADTALTEAGDEPVLRATVLGRLAFLTMQLDLDRGLALVDEAVGLLDAHRGPVDPDLIANALLLRAVAELALVRPTRDDEIARGLRLMTASGRSWEREGADGSAFGLARHTDDLDRAIEMTRELIRSKSGPGGDDPFNLVQLAGLLVARGHWPEARRMAEAAMDGYEREGADLHPAWGLRGVALVAAHDGRLDDARRDAEAGLRAATDRGDIVVAAMHRHILGFTALSVGQWRTADAELTEAAALAERISVRHPGRFKVAGDRVEAALALGDVERAAEIVATLEDAARVAPTPWVRAVGARSAGLLAAAAGDLGGAAVAFERAIREHERLAIPFELGRTLLATGRLHRRRKEKRLADETLRAALSVFEGLGAPIWAERTSGELDRVGLRPRASDDLTDTERQVAELAARGLSNRQIAEQAFLAPKTVGNVLGRVYLKLGIHSRAELGARMSGVLGSGVSGNGDEDLRPHREADSEPRH